VIDAAERGASAARQGAPMAAMHRTAASIQRIRRDTVFKAAA